MNWCNAGKRVYPHPLSAQALTLQRTILSSISKNTIRIVRGSTDSYLRMSSKGLLHPLPDTNLKRSSTAKTLFYLKRVAVTLCYGCGIHAGGGILTVDIESPVYTVLIVIGSDAVDGLNVKPVLTFLSLD